MQRRLAALRHELIPAPAGLVTLVLARMEVAPGGSWIRGPIIAGASVLTAAAPRSWWWLVGAASRPLDEAARLGCTLLSAHR